MASKWSNGTIENSKACNIELLEKCQLVCGDGLGLVGHIDIEKEHDPHTCQSTNLWNQHPPFEYNVKRLD